MQAEARTVAQTYVRTKNARAQTPTLTPPRNIKATQQNRKQNAQFHVSADKFSITHLSIRYLNK